MEQRQYTRELKFEAVKLIQERGVTVAQASCDLGVHGTVLRRWVQECAADPQQAFPGQEQTCHTVADVILPDGRSLNRELVAAGLAWWYRKYSKDESLGQLEAETRAAKRGLWADPDPMPPWCWRKQQKGQEC